MPDGEQAFSETTLGEALESVLAGSSGGLTFSSLRRRVGLATRIHEIALGLADLVRRDRISVECGIFWTLKQECITPRLGDFPVATALFPSMDRPPIIGDPSLVGPVWEPTFALKLWRKGLRVVQQYPAEGYFLDIALVSEIGGIRLDIEVDGRTTHCDRLGRRKVGDIIRDVRLTNAGWVVKRFWVSELMRDMDGCGEQVIQLWNQLGKDICYDDGREPESQTQAGAGCS